ncbi:jg15388 [Pararge aegeria aegeria]|uniref:Jg15388 protein n=1 Tax=Pararge aegeria aegeria TaxID=348720 RepID=A0A8S4S5Y7_9NEOP|nr:jg15388 [Pararge aegeria aegeria]
MIFAMEDHVTGTAHRSVPDVSRTFATTRRDKADGDPPCRPYQVSAHANAPHTLSEPMENKMACQRIVDCATSVLNMLFYSRSRGYNEFYDQVIHSAFHFDRIEKQ